MDRHHENLLKDALRDVLSLGATTLEWRLVYRWFNAQRMTKQRWQTFLALWDEVLAEAGDYDYRLGRQALDSPATVTFVLLPGRKCKEELFVPLENWA